MFFYISLVIIILGLFLVVYLNPCIEKTIALTLLGIMVLLGGFRDSIGADYNYYVDWYLNGTRDDGFEFGFLALMKLFRFFNLPPFFLFFFFSFFTYFFVYLGIRRYTSKALLPLILYILVPSLFLSSLCYVRQSLSIAISFYAFSYLLNKKHIVYFLWMLLGISIHYSCLLPFVVFLMVSKWGIIIKNHYLYLAIGFSFVIGQIGIIHWLSLLFEDSHYLYYFSKASIPVPFLKLMVLNCMALFIIKYYDKYESGNQYQRVLLLCYVFSVLFFNLFTESRELARLCIYFRIFEIVLMAQIINSVLSKKIFWMASIICCFYLFPYFRAIKMDSESSIPAESKLIPYKSLLLKSIQ